MYKQDWNGRATDHRTFASGVYHREETNSSLRAQKDYSLLFRAVGQKKDHEVATAQKNRSCPAEQEQEASFKKNA